MKRRKLRQKQKKFRKQRWIKPREYRFYGKTSKELKQSEEKNLSDLNIDNLLKLCKFFDFLSIILIT